MQREIRRVPPREIEAESFRIIDAELDRPGLDPGIRQVVRRVIHATGDFSFADSLHLHPEAIETGIRRLKAGKNILTDVNMVAAGISKVKLSRLGGRVICCLDDPSVADEAAASGKTRTETAILRGLDPEVGIVAVGNAPTALLAVMERLEGLPPAELPLVVGVPVGFVNAAESKELLSHKPYPFITCRGRKGGSPVAAAVVNALINLAIES